MYVYEVIRKSIELNGITRIRTNSGDTLEGKFSNQQNIDGMFEFVLTKGGTVYMLLGSVESITLLDNLQILEEADAKHSL